MEEAVSCAMRIEWLMRSVLLLELKVLTCNPCMRPAELHPDVHLS